MRLEVLRSALLAIAFVVVGVPAMAQDNASENPDQALAFVDQLANDALLVLDDTAMTQDERDQAFRDLLGKGFDLNYIGRLVLGRHWRGASGTQKSEFNEIFPEYVLRIYASRLTEFGDEEFEMGGTSPAGRRDVYVHSSVVRPNGPPIEADWRVRQKDGEYKIIDLKIEGISMVLTQRDEFSGRISQVGLDGLLVDLRDGAGMEDQVTARP